MCEKCRKAKKIKDKCAKCRSKHIVEKKVPGFISSASRPHVNQRSRFNHYY